MRTHRLSLAPTALAIVAYLSAPAAASSTTTPSITWDWNASVNMGGSDVRTEQGTFTTNYVAGATATSAPAGTYTITGFTIDSGTLGLPTVKQTVTPGFITQQFQWDGRSPTAFMTLAYGSVSNNSVAFPVGTGPLTFSAGHGYAPISLEYDGSPSFINGAAALAIASVNVPEPSTLAMALLLGLGAVGRLAARRLRRPAGV